MKSFADPVGVLTQCIQAKTFGRGDRSTLLNLCTKINSKYGGINNTLVSRASSAPSGGGGRSSFQQPPHSLRWMFNGHCIVVGIVFSHPENGTNPEPTAAFV